MSKLDSPVWMTVLTGVMAVLIGLSPTVPAVACEIPVYHYALENWDADQWEVLVFHRGNLSQSERQAVELLRAGADYRTGHANLLVRTVDLAANPDAVMMQRWAEQRNATLPWVAAYYPAVKRIAQPAWAGQLSAPDARALLDSPLRQKIASELASRVTASWILLESGDRGKDNAAWQLLQRELRRLEETLVLPVLEGWGPTGEANEPEEVKFTMHRLSRDSSAERMLVNMLLHSEPDLATKFARDPLVFPIYGRGLILYALAGSGINEWTISQAAEFLTGPCSCQVKASNPGTDLLVPLNWNERIKRTAAERMPPPAGIAGFQDRAAEAERRLAETEAQAGAAASSVRAPAGSARSAEGAATSRPRTTTPGTLSPPGAGSGRSGSAAARSSDVAPPVPVTPPTTPPAQDAGQQAAAVPAGPPDPEPAEDAPPAEDALEQQAAPEDQSEVDDDAVAAASQRVDSDPARGVARLLAALALVAAAITALITVVVIRSRHTPAEEREHEHVSP